MPGCELFEPEGSMPFAVAANGRLEHRTEKFVVTLEVTIQSRNLARARTENRYPLFLITRLRFSDNPMRKSKR